MDNLSLERITIYDPGFVAPRVLNVADLSASWGISEVGRLSCTAATGDVLDARNDSDTILGRWVIYDHPTCGVWTGYVEDSNIDLESGRTDLSCVGIVNLLQYRRSRIGDSPQQMSAGGLVLRAIEDSAQDDSVWLADVRIDDSDVILTYEQRAEPILEMMDRLVSDTGEEWLATSDDAGRQTLQWRQRVGSEEIVAQFYEDLAILGGQIESSISQLVNDILAVADDDQYTLATREVATDRVSILKYGRRQATNRYINITAGSALLTAAYRDLRASTLPTYLVTLQIDHMDTRLDVVREGSRIVLGLPSIDAAFRARVIARVVDVLQGTATVLCEVESQFGVESDYVEGAGSATSQGL